MPEQKYLKQDIKKHHHYLPVVYSKQWADDKGFLIIRHKDGKEFKVKPKNVFFENNLNSLTTITEQQFSIIETLYKGFLDSTHGIDIRNHIQKLYETTNILDVTAQDDLTMSVYIGDLPIIQGKFTKSELKDLNKIKQITLSNFIEDEFSDIETKYGQFIKRLSEEPSICKWSKLELTLHFQSVFLFAILQHFRSPCFRENKKKQLSKDFPGLDKNHMQNIFVLSEYIEYRKFILDLCKYEIHMDLAHNMSNEHILTSDSPFIKSSIEFNEKFKIHCNYIFPISPFYLMTISKGKQINDNKVPSLNLGIRICFGGLKEKLLIQEINKLVESSVYEKLIIPNIANLKTKEKPK